MRCRLRPIPHCHCTSNHLHLCCLHRQLQHPHCQQTLHSTGPHPQQPPTATTLPTICTPWQHLHHHSPRQPPQGRRGERRLHRHLYQPCPSKHQLYINKSQLYFFQIYQNNLPPPIKGYVTDVYLFCLYKDPLDKSKLRPLGIPIAICCLIASHVAHTFCKKFACHMLPFNYAVGTPNGKNLIINTMHPSPNQQTSYLPAQLCSLTSPTSLTVSPVKHSLKSLRIPSPKSSPSPPSSTNKRGPSTTNGLMAHGAPS